MASASARSAEPDTSEPAWLAERRGKAIDAAKELALPGPKTRGWEFTDLAALDLAAYEPAAAGDLEAAAGLATRLTVPAGSAGLTQVDAASRADLAVPSGNGRPDGVAVMSLSEGAERFRFRGGDPSSLRVHLENVLRDRMRSTAVKARVEA